MRCCRDVWKFCQIGLAPATRPILAKFPNMARTINPKLYSQSHDYLYLLFELVKQRSWRDLPDIRPVRKG